MNWFTNLFSSGSLTGEWKGYYEQNGKKFAIKLSLGQRGNRVSGRMMDLDSIHSQPLRKMLVDASMSSEQVEQFIEAVRSRFPNSPRGEIEYRSSLPSDSLIEGETDRSTISFRKQYDGYQEIEYRLDGLSLSLLAPCETIWYRGEISNDFNTISGNWMITVPDRTGEEVTGKFLLDRSLV